MPGGRILVSDPKFVIKRTFGKHTWVDSLHLASELPGFYTRYLVSVKGETAVAVTFSVNQKHYDQYAGLMNKVLNTVKIFGSTYRPGAINQELAKKLKQSEDNLDIDYKLEHAKFENVDIQRKSQKRAPASNKNSNEDSLLFFLVLLVGGVIGLKILKKKKVS